jgi:hypothetical protein
MKAFVPFSFGLGKANADYKALVIQQLKVRGSSQAPGAPRDVQATAGSRGALLTWKLPETNSDVIRGYRVYRDTESNLHATIDDSGIRQLYVTLTSGATPPVTNFFVSAISASGAESQKVPVQAVAIAEAGAPAVPAPPPGYTNENSGGADQSLYGGASTSSTGSRTGGSIGLNPGA